MIVPVLNIDLARHPDHVEVADTGASIVRFALWPTVTPADAAPFSGRGLGCWGVPVPQSCDWDDSAAVDRLFAAWAPRLTHVSGWNEPEGEGVAASTLDPAECQRRARLVVQCAKRHNPGIVLIAPEIARLPEYLHSIDLAPFGLLSAHIYGRVEDVPYYLPRFPGAKKIWIGETFCDPLGADGSLPPLWRALIANPRVRSIGVFWHSPPDAPGLGMEGNADKIAAFRALARGIAGGSNGVVTKGADEVWRDHWRALRSKASFDAAFGFEQYWMGHHQELGWPETDGEFAYDDGGAIRQARQFSRGGLAVWVDDGDGAGHVEVRGWPKAS